MNGMMPGGLGRLPLEPVKISIDYNPDWRVYSNVSDVPECAAISGCTCSLSAGVNCFSFADGHVEMHKWITSALKIPVKAGFTTSLVPATPGLKRNEDWVWFTQHATVHE